jgi:quinol monooxygenase YgiN
VQSKLWLAVVVVVALGSAKGHAASDRERAVEQAVEGTRALYGFLVFAGDRERQQQRHHVVDWDPYTSQPQQAVDALGQLEQTKAVEVACRALNAAERAHSQPCKVLVDARAHAEHALDTWLKHEDDAAAQRAAFMRTRIERTHSYEPGDVDTVAYADAWVAQKREVFARVFAVVGKPAPKKAFERALLTLHAIPAAVSGASDAASKHKS